MVSTAKMFHKIGPRAAVIIGVIILCILVLGINLSEYLESSTRTSIESTTSSLRDIIFPSVYICNVNQGQKLQYFFLKMGQALFHLVSSFQTHITILQQITVKNVHPVYGARIQTHDLWNMSLLP